LLQLGQASIVDLTTALGLAVCDNSLSLWYCLSYWAYFNSGHCCASSDGWCWV